MEQDKQKPLLEIIGVDKYYDSFQVLKNCSFNVNAGETIVIVGPSGSGKSTLLRCINKLEEFEGGNIFFENKDINEHEKELHLLRRQIGMVFQNFELFPHLSVIENIMLSPMKALGMTQEEAYSIAMKLLEKVRIPDKAHHLPEELSGGQQQRVAIARALAMKPKVMLFDEPTSALDPEMVREVLDVMMLLSQEGMTSIVVTHEMGFAKRAADHIVFMEQGEIIQKTTSEDFFSGNNPRARLFLNQILH